MVMVLIMDNEYSIIAEIVVAPFVKNALPRIYLYPIWPSMIMSVYAMDVISS